MGRTACTESQCLYKGALYVTLQQQWLRERARQTYNSSLDFVCPRWYRSGNNEIALASVVVTVANDKPIVINARTLDSFKMLPESLYIREIRNSTTFQQHFLQNSPHCATVQFLPATVNVLETFLEAIL